MILSLCLAVLVITTITCEPPLNNYLPPGSGSGPGGRPAAQYGPPESSQGRFDGLNSERGQPRSSFNPSSRESSQRPSAEYGPPKQGSQGFQDDFRGQQRANAPPSSQYRSPGQENSGRVRGGSNSGRGSLQAPESSYGTPQQGLPSAKQNEFNGQGASFQEQGSRRLGGGSPSSTYGTPDFGKDVDYTNQNYRRSGVDEFDESAKYEFSYEVDDVETGTMFGHSEQRNGDMTTGQYNVVLPDGRKQVVQYEANKDGFKPQIRYEGTGRGGQGSGFGRGTGREGQGSGFGRGTGREGQGSGFGRDVQSGNAPQGGRYQPPGFGQGTSSGYPGGRPSNVQDSFGDQGFSSAGVGSGYSGRPGGSSFTNRSPGDGFNGNLDVQGYASGPQGGRGSHSGGGFESNNGGNNEGYPSGGPSGLRGSGY